MNQNAGETVSSTVDATPELVMDIEFARFRSTIRPVSGPLHDVREHVVSMILDGRLAPGDALPAERELATSLGISRPAVREALRALEAVNVVESRRGAGTYVTALTPELLMSPLSYAFRLVRGSEKDLFQVRRFFEPLAAAEAATGLLDSDASDLKALMAALDESDVESFAEHDLDFHEWIVRQTDNPLLLSVIRGVRGLQRQVLVVTASEEESRRLSAEEHRVIAHAIQARDPERAKAAMVLHLARVEEQFLQR